MKSLLIYLLQLVIASGILYGYYHFFLRNKKFHQYNRYYLLSATIIAIIIPFLQIPFYFAKSEADSSPILKTLKTIYYTGPKDATVVSAYTDHFFFSVNILLYFLYILVAAVLLTRIIISLFKIKRIISANKSENLSGIRFINTTEPGTPFSFFRWLFWNKNIELQSANGQQIFRHEIFHIQQKHSWDVFFIEFLNMIFWVNPFFHIIKKEIKAIHEFLADEFAAKEQNKWEYAELLLTRALQTRQQLVNPFFHNQIKRRIAMITNPQTTSHRYLRKLLALPLITFAVILVAFTYKNKTTISYQDLMKPLKIDSAARKELPNVGVTSSDKRSTIKDTHVRKPNLNLLNVSDTSFKAYFSSNSIIVYDMFMKDTADEKLRFTPSTTTTFTSIKFYKDTSKPLDNILIVIDGKEHPDIKSSTDINEMDPNNISSIIVLKGRSAITKYGDKGKNGVIEITTKKIVSQTLSSQLNEAVIVGMREAKDHDTKLWGDAPSFVGGEKEWRTYLERNVNGLVPVNNGAPEGTYITVTQFLVKADGTTSEFKSLTNQGYGMEEEALRVIQNAQHWEPAVVNGEKVSAYKKQPVTFIIMTDGSDKSSLTKTNADQSPPIYAHPSNNQPAIYPNPSNNFVTIPFNSQLTGKGEIRITDINGNSKMTLGTSFIKGANNLRVNVASLAKGMYVVNVIDDSKKIVRVYKMVKQ